MRILTKIIIIVIIIYLLLYMTHIHLKTAWASAVSLGLAISLDRPRCIFPINKILPNDLRLCLDFTGNRINIF